MSKDADTSFRYFPNDYRWSQGMLMGLGAAPWRGAELGEVNRIGLRLKDRLGDDTAWFREWAAEARALEDRGRVLLGASKNASAVTYLLRAANYYHVGERFLHRC